MGDEPKSDEEKLLDYVEAQGAEALKFVLESADLLGKEAATTFSWLATFLGASVAFFTSAVVTNKPLWLSIAVGVTSFYLILAARRLLKDGLLTGDIEIPGNEPQHLLQPFPLNLIREENIKTLQGRIVRVRQRNKAKGAAINQARQAIFRAPIVCVLTAPAAACLINIFQA